MSELRFVLALPLLAVVAVCLIAAFWIMGESNFGGCCDSVFNKRGHNDEEPIT